MEVSFEDTARIARLAHLSFSDEELTVLSGELSRIFTWISAITAVDTSGVAPLTALTPERSSVRTDRPSPGLTQAEALANAPETGDGFIAAPRVLRI